MNYRMILCLAALVLAIVDGPRRTFAEEKRGTNVLLNGDFSDLDDNGRPRHWRLLTGNNKVETSIVDGPGGKKALKIDCTDFRGGWVILAQHNTVKARSGKRLYISFWTKTEKILSPYIPLHINRTRPWSKISGGNFLAGEGDGKWRKIEMVRSFGMNADNTRFQIHFEEEGVLYLSDLYAEETDRSWLDFNATRKRMIRETVIPKEKNILVNSSFETGMHAWGTEDFDHNVVELDETGSFHGRKSARIDLDSDSLPVGYRDYPDGRRLVHTTVRFVNQGFLRLEKEQKYTLSAYLKASDPATEVEFGMYYMSTSKKYLKQCSVSSEWKRYSLTFEAVDIFGAVMITARSRGEADKIWIDAVQLEKGPSASAYGPRYPVEIGLHAKRKGNLYYHDEEISIDLVKFFARPESTASVTITVLDYRDQAILTTEQALKADAVVSRLVLPFRRNGYYKVVARVRGKGYEYETHMPFAIIYPYVKTYGKMDSKFGLNHALYSDLCLELSKEAGAGWIRDWTLKWDVVEKEEGTFDFSRPDVSYDRARRFGFRTLSILPDPTSSWASTAPESVKGKRLGDSTADHWYLPRDMACYRRYAIECITRYKDVSGVFEIFNEPFKTQGWHVTEKYHEFLEAARMAVEKSNKDIEIMRCGLGYLSRDPDANLTATMLSDLTSEHGYATYNDSKQWIKKVAPKAEYYRKHNLKRDIWWTEYGKYVHDEPNYIYDRFDHFLGNKDECTSTAYSIKYLTILFSHGVTKVFFHSRFWPLCINKMWNGVYFDMHFKYGALPMKFFPACNAFAYLIPPGSSGGTPLMEDGPVFAYSFENEDEKILVFWTDKQEVKLEKEIVPDNVNLRTYDMMGGPLRTLRSAGDEPVYVIGKKSAVDAIAASLQ